MNTNQKQNLIRLFGMSTMQMRSSLQTIAQEQNLQLFETQIETLTEPKYYAQFDLLIRQRAKQMARHYEAFYCLENSIRTVVTESLFKKFGGEWWDKGVDEKIKLDVAERIRRDQDTGFTVRSENRLDFANFGELSNIIEKQWDCFDDLFTSKPAMKKVMSALNSLRGPIAHCGDLAEDEVKRLELAIKDWYRLMD